MTDMERAAHLDDWKLQTLMKSRPDLHQFLITEAISEILAYRDSIQEHEPRFWASTDTKRDEDWTGEGGESPGGGERRQNDRSSERQQPRTIFSGLRKRNSPVMAGKKQQVTSRRPQNLRHGRHIKPKGGNQR